MKTLKTQIHWYAKAMGFCLVMTGFTTCQNHTHLHNIEAQLAGMRQDMRSVEQHIHQLTNDSKESDIPEVIQ